MTTTIGTPGGTPERPAIFFATPEEFRNWLEANHATAAELWMGLYKKHVPDGGLTWEQAVPEALCFGWIDSMAQRIDEDARRQRWTPRKSSSIWSSVNIALVEKLTKEGRMREAGIAAFERRREDRSGVYSHENPHRELPPEAAAQLAANPAASAFWEAATATYRRQVTHWALTASRRPPANGGSRSLSTTAQPVGWFPSNAMATCRSGLNAPPTRRELRHPG